MNVDRRESRELCTIASTDFAQTHVDRIAGSVLPLVSHSEYMPEGQMDGRSPDRCFTFTAGRYQLSS